MQRFGLDGGARFVATEREQASENPGGRGADRAAAGRQHGLLRCGGSKHLWVVRGGLHSVA